MNDLDAEKLRPLFERLAGSIDPVSTGAYFEVIQDAGGVHHIRANAAGFVCAGIHLIRQGLNVTGVPDESSLMIDLRQFTIQKNKSGWLND